MQTAPAGRQPAFPAPPIPVETAVAAWKSRPLALPNSAPQLRALFPLRDPPKNSLDRRGGLRLECGLLRWEEKQS
jgi:hypothetical protein